MSYQIQTRIIFLNYYFNNYNKQMFKTQKTKENSKLLRLIKLRINGDKEFVL